MGIVRIIPRLDIKGPHLVKGIHMEGLRVLGNPERFARYYYEMGADEIMYMDVVASLYERNSLSDIITRTARQIFIPLTVGGGLRSLDDINNALRAGADKVCINTAALREPGFIKKAVNKFGSSTIVVGIEAIRQADGTYLCYTDNGREQTGIEVGEWATRVEELGAGEIVLTSVDMEGTGKGFDTELINLVAEKATVPVVAHGGAGKVQHISELLENTKCDAVALSSVLHYKAIEEITEDIDTGEAGNVDFLQSGRKNKNIFADTLPSIKSFLSDHGAQIRIV